MATVTYNGKTISPPPLIRRENRPIFYNGRWGMSEVFTLEGHLENCDGKDGLILAAKSLHDIFKDNYKTFKVQDGAEIVSRDYVKVDSVNFEGSDYISTVPYSITLECYPEDFFGEYGVLDPVDTWDFDEDESGVVTITHTTSARGFNTSNLALDNAKNFVSERVGINQIPSTVFLQLGTRNFALTTQRENVDRLGGTYGMVEVYLHDPKQDGKVGLMKFSVSVSSGIQGFNQVSVNGEVIGAINEPFSQVRGRYLSEDIYQIAHEYYTRVTDDNQLNSIPLTSGVTENEQARRLNFDLGFDNNPDPVVSLDYDVEVAEENDVSSISVKGAVRGRGDLKSRWEFVQQYYEAEVDAFELAEKNYDGDYSVNPNFLRSGAVFNEFLGEIQFNASFDDKEPPPKGLRDISYSIDFTPCVRAIASNPLVPRLGYESQYYTVDLGYNNRAEVRVAGSAILSEGVTIEEGKEIIRQEINKIFLEHGGANSSLTEAIVSSRPYFGGEMSFSAAWTFEGQPLNVEPNYEVAINLKP